MTAIKIVGLTKEYKDVVAVDNLNLEVKNGELPFRRKWSRKNNDN